MAEKKWLKITFESDPVLVESLCDFLIGVIGAGVETGAMDEASYGTINCYLEDPDLDQKAVSEILGKISDYVVELAGIFKVTVPAFTFETLGDEDWGKRWKEHFKPFAIVPDLIISPTWEKYESLPGEKVIVMDPGMAFGTGHHATTTLSLKLLSDSLSKNEDVSLLDIGTGTGVLGMAAVYFGAKTVLGIDNDPEAVSAAKENVLRNDMQTIMQVSLEPLDALEGGFFVVVANIVHDVLVGMVEDIERVTAEGGRLILSGILVGEQADNIINLYGKYGFVLEEKLTQQEWAALRMRKAEA